MRTNSFYYNFILTVIYLLSISSLLFALEEYIPCIRTEYQNFHSDYFFNPPPDSIIQEFINQIADSNLSVTIQRIQDFKTRYQDTDSSRACSQWIFDQLSMLEFYQVEFDSFHYYKPPWPDSAWDFRNVVATKYGVDNADKVIILGGHYDSISWDPDCTPDTLAPGADDNASGVSALLEIARILKENEISNTLQIVFFAAEEWGRLGSKAFSREAKKDSMDIELMINLDMIAHEVNGIWDIKIITDEESMEYAQLMSSLATQFVNITPEIELDGSFGSDHRPFWQEGYKAIWAFEHDFFEMLHTCSDVIDSLNITYLKEVTSMALATTITVVGLPGMGIHDSSDNLSLQKLFLLNQNYPNPFNPTTTISFDIPGELGIKQLTSLTVYDLRGHHVRTLVNKELEPGKHEVVWDGKNDLGQKVSSAIYLYSLKCGDARQTRKMVVIE